MIRFTYIMKGVKRLAKTTQEQMAKIAEWQKENVKQYTIRFNKKTDADILAKLERTKNVQGYIKEAIRAFDKNKKSGD